MDKTNFQSARRRFLKMAASAVLLSPGLGMAAERDKEASPFLVMLDPGHTPEKPGAISARGVDERVFNLAIADLVEEELKKLDGVKVAFTNRGNQSVSLRERARKANQARADIFLSIHHDGAQPKYFETWEYEGVKRRYCDKFSGFSLFVSDQKPLYHESVYFARALGSRLAGAGFTPALHHAVPEKGEGRKLLDSDLGVYSFPELVVLRETNMPAVLIEYGLIVNRDEEERLSDPATRRLLARLTGEAMADYRGWADSAGK